jgi:hypothetical protein
MARGAIDKTSRAFHPVLTIFSSRRFAFPSGHARRAKTAVSEYKLTIRVSRRSHMLLRCIALCMSQVRHHGNMLTGTADSHSLEDLRAGPPGRIEVENKRTRAGLLACIDLIERHRRSFPVGYDQKLT